MPVPLPERAPRAPSPPAPERQLRCCTASGCRSAGGEALLEALRAAAAAGGTGVPAIRSVGCLRLCGRGPLLACDGPDGTRLYGGVPPELAAALVAGARADAPAATNTAVAVGSPVAGEASPLTVPPRASAALDATAVEAAAVEAAAIDAMAIDAMAMGGDGVAATAAGASGGDSDSVDRADGAAAGAVDPDPIAGAAIAATAATGDAEATGDAAASIAAYRIDLDHPFFRLQRPVVLESCGLVDPESIADAIAHGAYSQLRRVLETCTPQQVRDEVRRSGLRGRGGAGYPTGLKWDTVALQPPGPRTVVCNADEGDPGAFMDRSVLESDPHRLIEGMAIAAFAVGADHGYVYVRAEYPLAIERLRLALQQARREGVLGRAIFGSPFSLTLEVRVGAGAYVCGEETALLLSIQGQRGMPRPRPPYPAQSGLWGTPTLINNVETFSAVPAILREGGDWYAAMGTEGSRGTKVFALSGAVVNTGLVEVPMGISLRTVVETMGGGVPDGGGVKAVQTGGPSGGCIPAEHLDAPVDYESLRELGSIMGSGGMVVMGETTAMPVVARHFMRFSVNESCGKCLPCRAGTVQLAALLDRFVEHRAEAADLERLEELCAMVQATSLCGLGQAAPNPVLSTLRWFRHEYAAALREPSHCEPPLACGLGPDGESRGYAT